jgi:hypothetical protein
LSISSRFIISVVVPLPLPSAPLEPGHHHKRGLNRLTSAREFELCPQEQPKLLVLLLLLVVVVAAAAAMMMMMMMMINM